MIRSIWDTLFLFMVVVLATPVFAASQGFVVASCPGTLGVNAYTAGQFGNITLDVNGLQCIAGSLTTTPATPAAGTAGAGFPPGATAVTGSATGTTGAVVATLPAVAGKFTYLCGFTATGNEAATGAVVAVTVAGTITGSLNFNISHSVTPTLGVLSPTMTPCVQGSAVNTAITVTSAADAAGTNVSVSAWGFQQ